MVISAGCTALVGRVDAVFRNKDEQAWRFYVSAYKLLTLNMDEYVAAFVRFHRRFNRYECRCAALFGIESL